MSDEIPANKLSLLALIKRGRVEEATHMLLTEMPSPEEIQFQDRDGDALFWSACRGYTLIAELLLMLGANVNNVSLASGATPLHAAADNGQADVIEILLKWGSDIQARNHFLDTACHLAAFRGHSRCVALLLKTGTNINLRNSRQNTVLDEAKYGEIVHSSGQHSIIKHLLHCYENSVTTGNNQQSSHEEEVS